LFGLIFLFGQMAYFNWPIGIVTRWLVAGIMVLELIVAFCRPTFSRS